MNKKKGCLIAALIAAGFVVIIVVTFVFLVVSAVRGLKNEGKYESPKKKGEAMETLSSERFIEIAGNMALVTIDRTDHFKENPEVASSLAYIMDLNDVANIETWIMAIVEDSNNANMSYVKFSQNEFGAKNYKEQRDDLVEKINKYNELYGQKDGTLTEIYKQKGTAETSFMASPRWDERGNYVASNLIVIIRTGSAVVRFDGILFKDIEFSNLKLAFEDLGAIGLPDKIDMPDHK